MKWIIALNLVVALAAPAAAQDLTLALFAGGMGKVTDMRQAPGDDERFFVTSANRGVYVFEEGQAPAFFFDMRTMVPALHNTQGLMSLEFHPDYQNNGKFYVLYMDENLVTNLVQYNVSADPDVADPSSAVQILGPFQQPAVTHNWDCLHFGLDGMLYVSTGDGVLSSDPVTSNSQDLGSILGKILRLDVDLPPPFVPADNPFVGVAGANEQIWMYGLRQPWRFAFDRLTNDLYIADVGGGHWEELNFLPASGGLGGQNFGWRCMEGTVCENFAGCNPMCNDPGWTDPFYEYPHGLRCAVIGGYVYRGAEIPALQGSYFFADYCSGEVYSLRYDGNQITDFVDRTAQLSPPAGTTQITSFAEDNAGELYLVDWSGGEIWKILPADDCSVTRYCSPSANSAGPGARLSTNRRTSIAENQFVLNGVLLPPNQLGILLFAPDQQSVPLGDGTLCIGGGLHRVLPPRSIDASGHTTVAIDFSTPPANQLQPGTSMNFQLWYRDPAAGGAGFNGSSAVQVDFCP